MSSLQCCRSTINSFNWRRNAIGNASLRAGFPALLPMSTNAITNSFVGISSSASASTSNVVFPSSTTSTTIQKTTDYKSSISISNKLPFRSFSSNNGGSNYVPNSTRWNLFQKVCIFSSLLFSSLIRQNKTNKK